MKSADQKRPLKVFLSYASQDKPLVRELSRRLVGEGWIDTWQDEKSLLPGQDWRVKIEEAVEDADVVIICLSNQSVTKEGHVQKELRYAREIALEKPMDAIFLIPLRLNECEVPRGLRFYQWADYFGDRKEETYQALLQSLRLRYDQKLRLEAEEKARQERLRLEAERIAREKAEKEAAEKARLKAEEEERQRIAKEEAERAAAEKAAREKAENIGKEFFDEFEKMHFQTVGGEKQRIAEEKVEREAAEKVAREKAENIGKEFFDEFEKMHFQTVGDEKQRIAEEKVEREAAEKAARGNANKETAEKVRQGLTALFQENDAASLDPKIEKPETKKVNSSSKRNFAIIVGSIIWIGIICAVLIGFVAIANYLKANVFSTPTMEILPQPTTTSAIIISIEPSITATSPSYPSTADAATATVAAALTSAAIAQLTIVPTSTAIPSTGYVDEIGVPGLVIMIIAFVVVILMARRLRSIPTN